MTYSPATIAWARQQADAPHWTRDYRKALRQVERVQLENVGGDLGADAPDSRIREAAQRRADSMLERISVLSRPMTPEAMHAWLAELVTGYGGIIPELDNANPAASLRAIVARVQCRLWWRRQLRRAVVRMRETQAMHAGEVSRRTRQVYVTHDTVRRKTQRNEANAAMLEATELEAADGEIITLAQAVAASVANKAIRRGELMTRIRGCEEWAKAAGMVGLFTTNTAPSRFHPQHFSGGKNERHDGSTPKDAQAWLCRTWARTRAAIKRAGVQVFGFRVAEPHHDGCPHWHMLLWANPEHLDKLRAAIRAHWLAEDGEEPGAQKYRVKFEAIRADKGGAVAYVAKYISKNIDDIGALEAEGHRDAHAGEQGDLFGATARRVEAWASAWGIRQFQAIGQPPVTVWRELRRVTEQAVQGASETVKRAHAAVNRTNERRADWRAYMDAQGGAMQGREYRVRMVHDDTERAGRYGDAQAPRVLGVMDVLRPGACVLSDRREWRPRGGWTQADRAAVGHVALWRECTNLETGLLVNGPQAAVREGVATSGAAPRAVHPWTRVNNCTRRGGPAYLMRAGIVGARYESSEPGGSINLKDPPDVPTYPPGNQRRPDEAAPGFRVTVHPGQLRASFRAI